MLKEAKLIIIIYTWNPCLRDVETKTLFWYVSYCFWLLSYFYLKLGPSESSVTSLAALAQHLCQGLLDPQQNENATGNGKQHYMGWKIPLNWMIWTYPHFRKPPFVFWMKCYDGHGHQDTNQACTDSGMTLGTLLWCTHPGRTAARRVRKAAANLVV